MTDSEIENAASMYAFALLKLTLDYNSAVVQYCAGVIARGKANRSQQKRMVEFLTKLNDKYQKDCKELADEAIAEFTR